MRKTHPILHLIGSLRLAVPLLVAIAGVLAWGTMYETRFGTAAVQRAVYQSWWFQAILGFLAVNLAAAALERYPWKRPHAPFLLAHLGIILILTGGIIGGRFGIDGQLIIPEGRSERVLQLPANVLSVRQRNPGIEHLLPTQFESTAWIHEPNAVFTPLLEGRAVRLVVDKYYPDAVVDETVTADGAEDNPAIRMVLGPPEGLQDELWLFARDPERFGAAWGDAHLLFLEPATDAQWRELTGDGPAPVGRGSLVIEWDAHRMRREIAVPETFKRPVPVPGTAYSITFKDYFADFALGEQGPVSRSEEPRNPAVAFVLSGPEGADAHLLFALHPDFPALHGRTQRIPVQVKYAHPAQAALPPNTAAVARGPDGGLTLVFTDAAGARTRVSPVAPGTAYKHPGLDVQVAVADHYPKAALSRNFRNRSDTVRAPALHVNAEEGERRAEAWVTMGEPVELPLGEDPLIVAYGPAQRELPFSVKLLDFRKIDYPGTQMAAGFESDIELTDSQRGIILMRTIKMNHPLRYRGFSLFQSSFIPGAVETTVLSLRNDPGTPFVYAGFLIVIAGVVLMFVTRTTSVKKPGRKRAGSAA